MEIPSWKLEETTMDFVIKLLQMALRYTSIWVFVNQLTKIARFILVKVIDMTGNLAWRYINQVVR